jgi:pantoate--beta-alanine ligase
VEVFRSLGSVRSYIKKCRLSGESIGFVPTMGCLHQGHLSLVEKSNLQDNRTIASIFINPLQFVKGEDFERYPRTESEDLERLSHSGVDMVFLPEESMIYPAGKVLTIAEGKISKILCGFHRPGHFDGVLQVVLKLLNLVQCDRIYLGQKDYQQWLLIKLMVEELFLETEVIPCPIIRESDGLAMSSRNRYLSESQRCLAAQFPKLLKKFHDYSGSTSTASAEEFIFKDLQKKGFEVDYVRILNSRDLSDSEDFSIPGNLRILGAVRLGKTRLIDNMAWGEQ